MRHRGLSGVSLGPNTHDRGKALLRAAAQNSAWFRLGEGCWEDRGSHASGIMLSEGLGMGKCIKLASLSSQGLPGVAVLGF